MNKRLSTVLPVLAAIVLVAAGLTIDKKFTNVWLDSPEAPPSSTGTVAYMQPIVPIDRGELTDTMTFYHISYGDTYAIIALQITDENNDTLVIDTMNDSRDLEIRGGDLYVVDGQIRAGGSSALTFDAAATIDANNEGITLSDTASFSAALPTRIPRIIKCANASSTSSTGWASVGTITITAGMLTSSSIVRIAAIFDLSAAQVDLKHIKINVDDGVAGASSPMQIANMASNVDAFYCERVIFCDGANSQVSMNTGLACGDHGGLSTGDHWDGAYDVTLAWTFTIYAKVTNAGDTIELLAAYVEVLK